MKRIFILIKLFFIFTLTSLGANAADNILNAVILEGVDDGYSIILKSDAVSKVKKVVESPDKLTLVISGVSSAPAVNVFYKNTPSASSLIVENSGRNDVKVHIKADNIQNSNIIFDIPASVPVFVKDSDKNENVAFNLFAIGLVCALAVLVKLLATEKRASEDYVQQNLKNRELELYRNNYSKGYLSTSISINTQYKRGYVSNSITKGKTLRQYESFSRIK